jgi:predicted Zn-ribbon and HTH transcriptional regulator
MKSKLLRHYCIDKTCGWQEASHKVKDALRCPKCDGLVMSEYIGKVRT